MNSYTGKYTHFMVCTVDQLLHVSQLLTLRPATVFFPRFPATGGGLIYPTYSKSDVICDRR